MASITNIVIDDLADDLFGKVRSDLIQFYGSQYYIDALFGLLYRKTISYANVRLPMNDVNSLRLFNKLYSLEHGEEGEILEFKRHAFVQNLKPVELMLNGYSYEIENHLFSEFRIW